MAKTLTVFPQVTIADLLCEVRRLDVPRFIEQTAALVSYVPDTPTTGPVGLVRALLEVPLPSGVPLAEWFAPYRDAGVDREWFEVVLKLRARGHEGASALAHEEAVGTAAYDTTWHGDEARPS